MDHAININKSMYYNRKGIPIPLDLWAHLFEQKDYKRVALTKLWFGAIEVSTVWLGLDHGFGVLDGSAPIIFETMVFTRWSWVERDMVRYATEEQALKGHEAMVRKWRSPLMLLKFIWNYLKR